MHYSAALVPPPDNTNSNNKGLKVTSDASMMANNELLISFNLV